MKRIRFFNRDHYKSNGPDSFVAKTAFTEAEAMKEAKKYKQRAYECGYCKQWHLTTQAWSPKQQR